MEPVIIPIVPTVKTVPARLDHFAGTPATYRVSESALYPIAGADQLVIEVRAGRTDFTDPRAATVIANPTGAGPWDLDLTSAQWNQPLYETASKDYWIVIYTTTGTALQVLYTATVHLAWHNASLLAPSPPNAALALNQAQADLLYAAIGSSAPTLTTARTIGITGDVTYTSPPFNGSANVTAAATLATTGVTATTYGGTSAIPVITVDAKGRITSASNASIAASPATVKTTTYTAVAGDILDLDTAGGAFTVTLPASPSAGDIITLYGTKYNWPTNNLTIGRNGRTIDGAAADIVIRKAYLRVQLIYSGTTWNTFFSSPQVDIQVFTASGTWYKPARAYSYEVLLIGGGGGGGSGRCDATTTADRWGGGGGSGAGIVLGKGLASFTGATESVTVGAGGAGGAGRSTLGNGIAGGYGGASLFGAYQAVGGNNGGGGTTATGTPGAATVNRCGSFPVFSTALYPAGAGNNIAGSTPSAITNIAQPTGGGGGGGLNASDTQHQGGAGGNLGVVTGPLIIGYSGGTAGAAGGGAGGNGNTTPYWAGIGGGGGGSSSEGASGAGGNGGGFGAGGGGGGASETGFVSGAGGNGSSGIVIVTTHCII